MILEGIVTTVGPDDAVNIAPMGPSVPLEYPGSDFATFELRPFCSSRTYANLTYLGEGVLHVSDDVLLLARAAIGAVEPHPVLFNAEVIRGRILAGACRAYEFRIVRRTDDPVRPTFSARVMRTHLLRPFFGFNRAHFAVLEAAILATRVHLLPADEIQADFRRLTRLVEKTGGPREREAFALLESYIEAHAARPADSP